MADLDQDEWKAGIKADENAFILDVRTDVEVEDGIIPNAKHIDIYLGQDFINQVEELDKSKSYYIYCRSGNRSGQACNIMEELGFDNTYNLVGGFNEWDGETSKN